MHLKDLDANPMALDGPKLQALQLYFLEVELCGFLQVSQRLHHRVPLSGDVQPWTIGGATALLLGDQLCCYLQRPRSH